MVKSGFFRFSSLRAPAQSALRRSRWAAAHVLMKVIMSLEERGEAELHMRCERSPRMLGALGDAVSGGGLFVEQAGADGEAALSAVFVVFVVVVVVVAVVAVGVPVTVDIHLAAVRRRSTGSTPLGVDGGHQSRHSARRLVVAKVDAIFKVEGLRGGHAPHEIARDRQQVITREGG